jgi:ribonucleotide reductase alpha subunit
MNTMFVTKRNGNVESVHFDKITERISKLVKEDEKKFVNPIMIAQKTVASIYNGITTEELDLESANICINLSTIHHKYAQIASRILVSNLHKKSNNTFTEKENLIQLELNLLDESWLQWINENALELNTMIDYSRDYIFDYFGFKTLERAYLIKVNTKVIETPQDMFMRVASFINQGNLELVKKTYDLMSLGYYTHASPTLFNAANKRSQLSSCFLMGTDDSLDGITKTWSDVSKISKWGGGIGLHISNVRAKDSLIKGTNGPSSGIIPMLKVYNEIARYVDQCFVGKTKVYTKHGLVALETIKPNNKVFTIDGSLQNVKKVYCDYYKGDILNFTIINDYESIKVTSKHPFYVIKNNNPNIDYTSFINKLKKNIICNEWIEAEKIEKYDYIGFPIPCYVKDNVDLDETDCYMYGLILLTCVFEENNIILYLSNIKFVEYSIKYLEKLTINFSLTKINSLYRIEWYYSSKFKFVKSQIFNENNDIYINEMILNLPEEKVKYVIKALLDNFNYSPGQDLILESPILLDNIKYILLKMGILCTGKQENDLKYILKIPKVKKIMNLYSVCEEEQINYFEYNKILYTQIKSITSEPIETLIYDLEIENNHNYLTQAGLVHNGGKRKGSIAIYLEPHHPDILAFLDLRKNFGAETERTRDLFTAVWLSDLFMKQVQNDDDWYLLCPDTCPNLTNVYGEEYEKLYWSYVKDNKYKNKVKARDIMKAILDSQLETGTPYIAYKDSINRKSNQKNIGTIKSSNLCVEILEYSDDKEYAVCNLASIAINKFIEPFSFNENDNWIIYSKEECKYCIWAKTFLENKEIKYIEIKNDLPANTKTYPQIMHNNILVGGYNELFDYIKGTFNYDKLYDVAYIATKNLNKIIDINFYPVIEAKTSNLKHRPIGLGIQGLADTLVLLRIPFDSDEAIDFNKKMMETIYLASLTASNDLSIERLEDLKDKEFGIIPHFYDPNFISSTHNNLYHLHKINNFELKTNFIGAYSTFENSPFSQGQFQFDLWNVEPLYKDKWAILKEKVIKYGVRNSLLTALMPTASTSQILGNNECFEFFTNNIYTRRTLAGDFPLINKYLLDDLYDLNLWTTEMKQMIIANNGSIASFKHIPEKIRRLYQTIWEIKQIWVLKNAVARGPFIDQTQSMNIFMAIPDYQKLYSCHFWAWSNGLKTGIYYLRSKPSKEATKFTIDNSIINKIKKLNEEHDICENCSA